MKGSAFSAITAMVASMAFASVNVTGLHDRSIRRRDFSVNDSDAYKATSKGETRERFLHYHHPNHHGGMMHSGMHHMMDSFSLSASSDKDSMSRRSNRSHKHGNRHHHKGSSPRDHFPDTFQGYHHLRISAPKDGWNPMHYHQQPPPPFPRKEIDSDFMEMNFRPPQPLSTHQQFIEECVCEENWNPATCDKWGSYMLTLSLSEEYCAENCCVDAEEVITDDSKVEHRVEVADMAGEDDVTASSDAASSSSSASSDTASSVLVISDSASNDSVSSDSEVPEKYEVTDVETDDASVEIEAEPGTEDEQFVDEREEVKILRAGDVPMVFDAIELEISTEQKVREELEVAQSNDINN